MFRRYEIIASSALILTLVAGCGVQGTWVTRDVQPPEAAKEFNLTRVTFKPDMSFEATAKENGKVTEHKGTYAYDEWTKTLTVSADGKERKYTACTWWFGKELRIEKKMEDGQMMKATLAPCPGCGCGKECQGKGSDKAE
jgi:hypothetical protein